MLENPIISIKKIILSDEWNRTAVCKPEEIIESIRTRGQLHPLLVRLSEQKPGYVVLIDGRRRLYALQTLGIKEAKICIVNINTDAKAYLVSLISNMSREDNTAYEKACAFHKLSTYYGVTQDEIATSCGKSPGYVSQYLAVMRASPELQQALAAGQVAITMFRLFSRLDKEEDKKVYNKLAAGVIAQQLSYAEVESRISEYLEKKNGGKPVALRGAAAHVNNAPALDLPDYSTPEIRSAMKLVTKDTAISLLTYYSAEYKKSTRRDERRYYEGILDGLELSAGLKEAN